MSPPASAAVPAAAPMARGGARLLPRSLFGRLMAVLVLGLVAAQGLGLWINLTERDQLLLRHAGWQPAQRVADLVLLLDSLEPAERERIARVMSAPPLRVRLLAQAEPLPPLPEDLPGLPAAPRAHLAMYRAALQAALGDDRPADVRLLPAGGSLPADAAAWRRWAREVREARQLARANRDTPPSDAAHAQHPGPADATTGRRPSLLFLAQVRLQDGQWLRMETRLPGADASLPLRALASLSLLLLTVLALSWWAVRRVTRPLRDLAEAADGLGRNLHQPPLPDAGPDEVRAAHRAFNTMQTRLARYIEDRTRMLAAMSHDLKTPLTRMRLRAELLDDEALRQRFEHDLDEMSQMVSDTLEFMRGLENATERRPVDVLAVLESLQADQQAMHRDVQLSGHALAPWLGDAARLRRCVGNLVDNAVLYGQRAHLHLEDSPGTLTIRVRDAGPGLPADALERVFEPFVRLEASRNRVTGGTGLGLAIARNIARAAGGEVSLRNHPDGGLEACLSLPRSTPG